MLVVSPTLVTIPIKSLDLLIVYKVWLLELKILNGEFVGVSDTAIGSAPIGFLKITCCPVVKGWFGIKILWVGIKVLYVVIPIL